MPDWCHCVDAAINCIPEDAWVPVQYPGSVVYPDTGARLDVLAVIEPMPRS